MKIAFVDLVAQDYNPSSVASTPLGGMQSGVCYLSKALRNRGHLVYLYNRGGNEGVYDGVVCRCVNDHSPSWDFDDVDVFISVFCDGRRLRAKIGTKPLILFTGHNADEPTVQKLSDPAERDCWDAFVFKTNWQALAFKQRFDINDRKLNIITNAASPFFPRQKARRGFFFETRRPPVLYYSSTPFRGLQLLIYAYPTIKRLAPGITAKIFSSMAVYGIIGERDQYSDLYHLCRHVGMDYIGSVTHEQLAREIGNADILAFPSVYPETSCITVMEAMFNSSVIVSHDLGAIRETSAGFGHFLPCDDNASDTKMADNFAKLLLTVISNYNKDPVGGRAHLEAERAYALQNYTWERKGEEWERFLSDFLRKRGGEGGAYRVRRSEKRHFYTAVHTMVGKKIYVDPFDERGKRLILSGGNFNPTAMLIWKALLELRPWSVVIDVGANYGEMLANGGMPPGAEVIAVEANPGVSPFLRETLKHEDRIEIIEDAVADTIGASWFFCDRNWSGKSRLTSDDWGAIRVRTTTLSEIIRRRIGEKTSQAALLLKLDIEGAEARALNGLSSVLPELADFATLTEVSNLRENDFDGVFAKFSVVAFNVITRTFEAVQNRREFERLRPTLWAEDVVLFRTGDAARQKTRLLNRRRARR